MSLQAGASRRAQYSSLSDLRKALGGTRDITKLLVANNGLAAVKGIRSIQQWCFEHTGKTDAIQFEVMATPDDLGVNAEFVRLADHYVEVPGGSNANNYANVDLIVSIAQQQGCDAVYPGWGHASENPNLPRDLDRTRRVVFLGPPEGPMFALGDKIASSIIAQSLDVPTVPWSGDALRVPPGTLKVDQEIYEKAYVHSADECLSVCQRVGFPVMLKASEGGGGKGIRKVTRMEDVVANFEAVREEVKGCHIFVMRMLENVRHLEVQLLADRYGACCAVRTRDCSVQRRHQKIIEEGPVVGVDPAVVERMEAAAIRLAVNVGYSGLGTVEFMYNKDDGTFCFLELNPRIQVEHPVSELVSDVNLPAALLCVGLGVPLHRIPEIRTYYGESDPFGTSNIDFKTRKPVPPRNHAIAVRITAEDVDEGFRPTTGSVDEISFRNSQQCWGYFSIGATGGGIHQFADSQFGHVFATGQDREEARRALVMALRGITVRGEIRTSTAYVVELLEMDAFRNNDVSTAWLDGLIASRTLRPRESDVFPAMAAAAVFRMIRASENNFEKYESFLKAGHTPSVDYLAHQRQDSFIFGGKKYVVGASRATPNIFALCLNDDIVEIPCRAHSSGLQLTIGGRNILAYGEEESAGVRITINGRALVFTNESDPSKLRATVPGRLVRFLIPDGGHVSESEAYCEIEVMKMILQLKSLVSGKVHLRATPGSSLTAGKLLAEIEPDDPANVARAEHDTTVQWPASFHERSGIAAFGSSNNLSSSNAAASASGSPHKRDSPQKSPSRTTAGGGSSPSLERLDAVARARVAVDSLWHLITGYHASGADVTERLSWCIDNLASLGLSSVTLKGIASACLADVPADVLESQAPNDKIRALFSIIIGEFLRVESAFDGKTRAEAVEKLKEKVPEEDATKVIYAMDYAHERTFRHDVVMGILRHLEKDAPLLNSCQHIFVSIINTLRQAAVYGPILLQARYLLRKCNVKSFEERKAELCSKLEGGHVTNIVSTSVSLDLMCAVLFDPRYPNLVPPLMELMIRRSFYGNAEVGSIDVFKAGSPAVWRGEWRLGKRTDEEPLILRDDAAAASASSTGSPVVGSGTSISSAAAESDSMLRASVGHFTIYQDELEMERDFGNFVASAVNADDRGTSSVLHVYVHTRQLSQADLLQRSRALIEPLLGTLRDNSADTCVVEQITFFFQGPPQGPLMFTFCRSRDFEEDPLLRNSNPSTIHRLELPRLCNYNVQMFPAEHRKVHLYVATPPNVKQPSAHERRLFVRMYLCPGDLDLEPWAVLGDDDCGRMLNMVIAAVELAQSDKNLGPTNFNHLFINLVELTFDLSKMHQSFKALAKTFSHTLFRLGFRECELKFRIRSQNGGIPFRVFLSNHTTYSLSIDEYVEVLDPETKETRLRRAGCFDDVQCLLHSIRGSAGSNSGGSPRTRWGGGGGQSMVDLDKHLEDDNDIDAASTPPPRNSVDEGRLQHLLDAIPRQTTNVLSRDAMTAVPIQARDAYAPLTKAQVRRLQAQAAGTPFVYDWLTIFQSVLTKQWRAFLAARKLDESLAPARAFEGVQMHYDGVTKSLVDGAPGAAEQSGMLAWRCTVSSPSYFNVESKAVRSRPIMLVANDITFQQGSFSVTEDLVFDAASVWAREHNVPFVYVSANAGARLGLCNEIKQCFRAASRGDTLDYLYLTPEDHERLEQSNVRVHSEVVKTPEGEVRHKILDIIGGSEYIGVENLQGSALIAGQMSLNYATIPTLSIVTGRSVGIGAYLVRLGRRVIQTQASPIILTGASAINRLLGKEVYTGNSQLGGNGIMQPNGVTHWGAGDDIDAAVISLHWLDCLPRHAQAEGGCPPPHPLADRAIALPVADPIDRDVTFAPLKATPYDPRCLIQGTPGDDEGTPATLGMFDVGSWRESLSDWARTVVCGRAALGGIPCGVIAVETRTVRKFDPADPADPSSTARFVSQAGQVWFPDSARKTADALEDFHRERLPCFILANWRGFSGGMRDMFDEVIKFGATIVDNLRVYRQPVFIYIPPFGELRGGAWVVVDPVINHNGCVTMYCDPSARGGILEPNGVVEIKFREKEVRECIRRNHPEIAKEADPAIAKKLEAQLLPRYTDIAVHFADLHDTPGRMKAKGCIVDAVAWKDARRVFYKLLTGRLHECALAETLLTAEGICAGPAFSCGLAKVAELARADGKTAGTDAFFEWAASSATREKIAAMAQRQRSQAAAAATVQLKEGSEEEMDAAVAAMLRAGGAKFAEAMRRALA